MDSTPPVPHLRPEKRSVPVAGLANGAPKRFRHGSASEVKDAMDTTLSAPDVRPVQTRSKDQGSEYESTDLDPSDGRESAATSPSAEVLSKALESAEWQYTTERVVKSVVSVQFATVTPFDTEGAFVSEATGFVVDADLGIIMTNRHVVGPGPFYGFAVFDNHEECVVKPIYRDPVHDFGFLRFNPADIKHMKVQALELRPDLAKVGCEIRVVGNDAGEKLSILSGFISRLDRNAPDYGTMTYNDFNTEYIQAAASTSGGSSGSPVVNVDGYAVALQAGGSTNAATDFFLPLYRGKRALECLRRGEQIVRGTIQTQWMLKPFDECSRLGLTEEAENAARKRFPDAIGLLVAETVLPQGPSDGSIHEGDCLISINDEPISTFRRVDEILDSSVGQQIKIEVQRGGANVISNIDVGDLHAITPDRYVEVSGAVFHNVSYQIARLYAIPVKGVYIAETGSCFRAGDETTGWILDELDHRPTRDLDEFISVVQTIPDTKRVSIRYRHVADLHTVRNSIVWVDRHWHKSMTLVVRNDESGLWDFEELGSPLPAEPILPQRAKFLDLRIENENCSRLVKSFVKVSRYMAARIAGFHYSHYVHEYGLVIDAEKGYVLTTRYAIPHDMLDVYVTVAESVIVPAKVVFMHPLHNYAIVQYDPKLVDAPIESARLSSEPVRQGSNVTFIGFNEHLRIVSTQTRVTDLSTLVVPFNLSAAPRYRGTNLDSVGVETQMSDECGTGVFVDDEGVVRAFWMTFLGDSGANGRERLYRLALDTAEFHGVIEQLRAGELPNPRFLDIELSSIQLVQARVCGVSEEWIRRVEDSSSDRRQFFNILRVGSGASQSLEEGDILLAVNDQLVTRVLDLDVARDRESVELTVVRKGKEMTVQVPTVASNDLIIDRVLSWSGLVIHTPHHAVNQQIKQVPSEVYVVYCISGSPANQYGFSSTQFITHVNGIATPTLDKFWQVVTQIPDNTYVRLRVVTFDNLPCACSLRTNYHYFPTSERVRDDQGQWATLAYKDGKLEEGGHVAI